MQPLWTFLLLVGYFGVLYTIGRFTARRATSSTFYMGNRTSPWWVIAFGMVGTSLSGISLISIPGWVESTGMSYMQMVLGYVVGYYIIAYVLLPVYYRLELPSIYTYLNGRFGLVSYRTGASLFIVSRTVVASFRLFVVAVVLHEMVFEAWGVPFWLSVLITLLLIWVYTHRAGIQTIIWTDTFQTAVMLGCIVLTVGYVCQALDFSLWEAVGAVAEHRDAWVLEWGDWGSKQHFVKQFLTGAFIPVVMTGLDQDMMQKNLGCRNLRDAQRNMISYGWSFLPINLLLLGLGVLLVVFAERMGVDPIPIGDKLYPTLATGSLLPPVVGVLFTLGVIAAAYSSADSALTALTTSFTIDILNLGGAEEGRSRRMRLAVHAGMAGVMLGLILLFRAVGGGSVIALLFTAVGYLYGPLLGLYAFGLFTRCRTRERVVPVVALLAPLVCWGLKCGVVEWWGYSLGYELLLLNGAITFVGLWLFRQRRDVVEATCAQA